MIANINWNATNTSWGIVPASGMFTASTAAVPVLGSAGTAATALPPIRPFSPKYCVGSPKKLNLSSPNDIE